MKILGIIPARAGSKGIPNKNRKILGGKPLLQYTIEAALGAEMLDTIVFSSESSVLIKLAHSFGVEAPFVRPQVLAADTAGSLEVVQHALKYYTDRDIHFDAVCLLQVTSPFRKASDIDAAIEKFKKSDSDSLISVQKVPDHFNPHWVFEEKDGTLCIATGEKSIIKRRQDLPKAFIRDGAIYITKSDVLMQQNSFFGKAIAHIELDPETSVNIDTMEDWERAKKLIN